MKVAVFRADCTEKQGLGHLMRCITLATEIKKNNFKIYFLTNGLNTKLTRYLKNKKFNLISTNSSKYLQNKKKFENFDLKQTLNILTKIGFVDLLILDHYSLSIKWEKRIKKAVGRLVVIDDYFNRKHFCDYYLNQNLLAKNFLKKIFIKGKKVKFLLGGDYLTVNEKLKKYKARKKKNKIKNIGIYFGASDNKNLTLKFIKLLKNTNYNFSVVIGTNNSNYKEILKETKNKKNFRVIKNQIFLGNFLKNCDLLICSGGQITIERLFFGIQAIVYPVNLNQFLFAKSLEKLKLIKQVRNYKKINKDKLKKALNLSPRKEYLKLRKEKTLNFFGTKKIVQIILNKIIQEKLKLKKISRTDKFFLWSLRSEKLVKKNSLDRREISFDKHEKWFEKKFNSKKTNIFKLCLNDLPIGQIRFDIQKNNFAEIDYSISENFRSNSYGNHLLSLGIKKMIKNKIKKFSAVVKKNNFISQKIFKKNNFIITNKNKNKIYFKRAI